MISRLLCFIALFSALPLVLHAQSTETDLKTRLAHKPLYLRGCWRDVTLQFDSAGHLEGDSSPVPFTLSGFALKQVHLTQDKLILEGIRVGLELAKDKQKRVPLNADKPNHQKDIPINITIAASPTGDYGHALDAIFADGLDSLTPTLPFYWKDYALKNFAPANSATNATAAPPPPAPPPKHVKSSIIHPKLLHSKEPDFNDAARNLLYSGAGLYHLHVEADGKVTHLSILKPLGLGLDERALVAVQQYVFAPATENGKPIATELNVEVNFQIY
jgi:TonB family protein